VSRKHPQNNTALVRALVDARVEFIVIGGVAAILHGVSRVEPIGDYHALQAVEMALAGHMVRVIERRQLIAVKESLMRPKDREVVLELRAIEERESRKP
jgi:hypothetical protein